jgi:alkylated DNA repair dioxygenase AlkB
MTQLSLFDAEEFYEFPKDLLEYKKNFLSWEEADLLKNKLLETASWEQRTQKMYDKVVLTPRLTAWYGDSKYSDSEENKNQRIHGLLNCSL